MFSEEWVYFWRPRRCWNYLEFIVEPVLLSNFDIRENDPLPHSFPVVFVDCIIYSLFYPVG